MSRVRWIMKTCTKKWQNNQPVSCSHYIEEEGCVLKRLKVQGKHTAGLLESAEFRLKGVLSLVGYTIDALPVL